MAVFLDGKTCRRDDGHALGITLTGEKRFLGFVETDTENATVLTPFLRSLVERGLDLSQGVLVILDGGKGLRTAVRKAFRNRPWQRCQWHKRENVVHPSTSRRRGVSASCAYNRPDYDDLGALETLLGELDERNQSAAGSLAEGLDETLTLHRLGCTGYWAGRSRRRTVWSLSMRWSRNGARRSITGRPRSQRHRWLATALLDIEPRLRKVMGLPPPVQAS